MLAMLLGGLGLTLAGIFLAFGRIRAMPKSLNGILMSGHGSAKPFANATARAAC
jgi:hypothetical protein